MTPACLGGWCAVRDRCERHITDDREIVAERLCERGAVVSFLLHLLVILLFVRL